MATTLKLCVLLLAASGVCAFRMDAKQKAAQKELLLAKLKSDAQELTTQTALARMDGTKLSQLLTTVVGIATSMVSAFSEEPPDFEYAFDSLNMQGWKMVTLIVPADHQKTSEFKKAKQAWRVAFEDSGLIIEGLVNAAKEGNVKEIIEAVSGLIGTALKAAAAAVPEDEELIRAISDLVQGTVNKWLGFSTAMGWLSDGGSFLQVSLQAQSDHVAKFDGSKLAQLLTTSVGIVTTFISAFTEVPPDFEYAFDSMKLQGWKLVKLCVSEEKHGTDRFKNAQKAWNRVFTDASGIAEHIMQATKGDIGAIVKSVLNTIDTALKTAAEVVEPDVAKTLEAVGNLILGTGGDWLQFSCRIGWLPAESCSPQKGR